MHELPQTGDQKAVETKRKATSCDLCADLPEPSCVYACPHDAAHRVEPNQFIKNLISPSIVDRAFVTPGGRGRAVRPINEIDERIVPGLRVGPILAVATIAYIAYAINYPSGPGGRSLTA